MRAILRLVYAAVTVLKAYRGENRLRMDVVPWAAAGSYALRMRERWGREPRWSLTIEKLDFGSRRSARLKERRRGGKDRGVRVLHITIGWLRCRVIDGALIAVREMRDAASRSVRIERLNDVCCRSDSYIDALMQTLQGKHFAA